MKYLKYIFIFLIGISLSGIAEEMKEVNQLLQQGKMEEALKAVTVKLEQNPYHNESLAYRIDINIALRKWNDVLKDLDQLIKIFPKSDKLLSKRAMIYQILGKYKEAFADLDASATINPRNPNLCIDKARIYIAQEKLNHAIIELSKTLELMPNNVPALLMRAELWVVTKDLDNAIVDFNNVLASEPGNTQALNSLAWFMATWPDAKYRNGKRSIELATKACELSEWKNVAIIDTLAAAYAEDKQFDKAVEYLKMALLTCPKDLVEEITNRLEAFKEGKPHREVPVVK